ncbi:MAG TPA: hypothetical protein PLU78_06495 [Chitinophagales bacterium]|nr:hypothetical protein [Chitinophagales bacterium]
MTAQRRDNHSTEFGLWLRKQSEIDSSLGFLATNIDYLWRNYKTNEWMFIEEKRFNSQPKYWQQQSFQLVDKVSQNDPFYRGFHYLIFEHTTPEDGFIRLNNQIITREQLIAFLKFSRGV